MYLMALGLTFAATTTHREHHQYMMRECVSTRASSIVPWALGPMPSRVGALVHSPDTRFGFMPLDGGSSERQAMPNAGVEHDQVVRSGFDLPAVE